MGHVAEGGKTHMTPSFPVLHVARIVVEAETPISIGTGAYDRRFDSLLLRDANGLPALPGSAIAGALRRGLTSARGETWVDKIFGRPIHHTNAANESGETDPNVPDFEASRLTVSWGAVHDACNRPVRGLQLGGLDRNDALLRLLTEEQPLIRNNVRISAKTGAVDERGKFSRTLVPKGAHFSFEMALASSSIDDPDWATLLAHVRCGFRIGGATRRGIGGLSCKQISCRIFDLRNLHDLRAFSAYQAAPETFDLADWTPLSSAIDSAATHAMERWLSLEFELQAIDCLRIGSGNQAIGATALPNMVMPVLERVIVWNGDYASIEERVLVCPGASLKGALAHRMTFHAHRATGQFVDDGISAWLEAPSNGRATRPPVVDQAAIIDLLGYVPAAVPDASSSQLRPSAMAGHVYIDDVYASRDGLAVGVMPHNSIDRFSAGTRGGILYAEELLHGVKIPVRVRIDRFGTAKRASRQAFADALIDLVAGRLAVGAASAKGHGHFKSSTLSLDALQSWIEAGQ